MRRFLITISLVLMAGLAYGAYVPKVAKVYVTELTVADTWTEVLAASRVTGIRGYKIKARFDGTNAPAAFDYAFNSSPDVGVSGSGKGFYTNTGVGSGDAAGPTNGIWARSSTAGTLIEVVTYE